MYIFRTLSIPAEFGLKIRLANKKFHEILPNELLPAILDKNAEIVGIVVGSKLCALYDVSKQFRVVYSTKEKVFFRIRPEQKVYTAGSKVVLPDVRNRPQQ